MAGDVDFGSDDRRGSSVHDESDGRGARYVDGTVHQYRAVCPCGVSTDWHEQRDLALESLDAMNGYKTPPDGETEDCCDETAQLQTREVPLEDLNNCDSAHAPRSSSSEDGTDHLWVVRAPHRSWWADDYETAYQLATGTTSERGGDDHPREQDIRVMHTGGEQADE